MWWGALLFVQGVFYSIAFRLKKRLKNGHE